MNPRGARCYHRAMKMPEGISKWEIAGVSAWPIVEAMISMELPAKLGWTSEQFFSVLAGLMTAMAIARALADSRKAKAPKPE